MSESENMVINEETIKNEDDVWRYYNGPSHHVFCEKDPNCLRYLRKLYSKVETFSLKSNKHLAHFCSGCFCFVTLQGKRRDELGHPNSLIKSAKQLFKEEGINDEDSFISWITRTPFKTMYKGRMKERYITPVFNQYHDPCEYDGMESNKEKRQHAYDLERKVKRLQAENEELRKRLLISHVLEFSLPDKDPRKKIR